MTKRSYAAPRVVEAGEFRTVTNGWYRGKWRDIYGGRAFIRIQVS